VPAPWRLPLQSPEEQAPKRSPESTRWTKGQSGNYRGRPPGPPKYDLPFDEFVKRKVTVVINGSRRELSRLEALLHKAALLAFNGDDEIASLLERIYINERFARFMRNEHIGSQIIRDGPDEEVCDDAFARFLRSLKIASRRTKRRVMLEPWIVAEALARMPAGSLRPDEQRVVMRSTSTAKKVVWPAWWEIRP
jgi:hypothetical protein